MMIFLFSLSLFVVALAVKLFHYRAAIIQLQADMTLVLNDLTRPDPNPSMVCNRCDRRMTLSEYATHRCGVMTQRAEAMSAAQKIRVPASYEERLALHRQHEHAI